MSLKIHRIDVDYHTWHIKSSFLIYTVANRLRYNFLYYISYSLITLYYDSISSFTIIVIYILVVYITAFYIT